MPSRSSPSRLSQGTPLGFQLFTKEHRFLGFPPVSLRLPILFTAAHISRVNLHSPSPPHRLQQIACTLYFEINSALICNLRINTTTFDVAFTREVRLLSSRVHAHSARAALARLSLRSPHTPSASPTSSARPHSRRRTHPRPDPCALSTRCPLCAIHALSHHTRTC